MMTKSSPGSRREGAVVVGTPRHSNERRQPPMPCGCRGPNLKSTALAHPPLRWETPGPERGGPRVACCKGHHQLTASAPAQSAVLEEGAGELHAETGAMEPRVRAQVPAGSLGAIPGLSPASGVARNPQASLAGGVALWSLPQPAHVPSSPPPLRFVSLPLLCLEDTAPNHGTEGSTLRPR